MRLATLVTDKLLDFGRRNWCTVCVCCVCVCCVVLCVCVCHVYVGETVRETVASCTYVYNLQIYLLPHHCMSFSIDLLQEIDVNSAEYKAKVREGSCY